MTTGQEVRGDTAMIVGCQGVTQMMEQSKGLPCDEQLQQARKAASAIAKKFGMSPKDLPPALRSRFEDWGKKSKQRLLHF